MYGERWSECVFWMTNVELCPECGCNNPAPWCLRLEQRRIVRKRERDADRSRQGRGEWERWKKTTVISTDITATQSHWWLRCSADTKPPFGRTARIPGGGSFPQLTDRKLGELLSCVIPSDVRQGSSDVMAVWTWLLLREDYWGQLRKLNATCADMSKSDVWWDLNKRHYFYIWICLVQNKQTKVSCFHPESLSDYRKLKNELF